MTALPPIITIPPPPVRPKAAEGMTDTEWAHVWRYAYQSAYSRVSLMYTVKRWFKSKLMWFGGLLTTAGAGLEIAATTLADERALVLQAFGTWGPWALIGAGISIKALRLITSGKLTK
jgi:hypothetical protein